MNVYMSIWLGVGSSQRRNRRKSGPITSRRIGKKEITERQASPFVVSLQRRILKTLTQEGRGSKPRRTDETSKKEKHELQF